MVRSIALPNFVFNTCIEQEALSDLLKFTQKGHTPRSSLITFLALSLILDTMPRSNSWPPKARVKVTNRSERTTRYVLGAGDAFPSLPPFLPSPD